MIFLNKQTKQEIRKLKKIMRIAHDMQDIYIALDLIYERISNHPEQEYSKKYGLAEILKSKTLKEFKKEFYYNSTRFLGGAILEVVAYKQAPQRITILYNEFNNIGEQVRFEIFILKEKTL